MPDRSRLAVPVSEEHDHFLGPAKARLTLVEYGDYECPHCARAHLMLQELLPAHADTVRLAFRNFPLSQAHPHAERAAEAAEAAAAQGKFWEMHDTLFENQDALEDENLIGYAQALGLDAAKFERELSEGVYTEKVKQDFREGVRSGVNGTPTFFINGIRYDGSWELDAMTALFADLLGTRGKGRAR
jgi:protein-disulfide isomerase